MADNCIEIGTILQGRYMVMEYLTQGGYGNVYTGRDLQSPDGQRKVAIKVVCPININALKNNEDEA